MSAIFPSAGWFRRLSHLMAAHARNCREADTMDLTVVPRITFPDGHSEVYSLAFEGHRCRQVCQPESPEALRGRHAIILEAEYGAWREMIENIRREGHADLTHTLDHLTTLHTPFRLVPVDDGAGQLDIDRFYRHSRMLQEFFDEAAALDTRFADGG